MEYDLNRCLPMASSYTPFGLSTHEHLLPGGRFPDDKPYVKKESCGSACMCKKCCALQESFHSAQIEQAKAARKSWEEAEKAAFKSQELQKGKIEDSKRIARLEKQVAELQKRVSELQTLPASPPNEKRSYIIRGILY